MSDKHYQENYNTYLNAEKETQFSNWVKQQSEKRGRNVADDTLNYDLRGYWLNGGSEDTGSGHMPDTYKKPNHPSFSDQSKYHNAPDGRGGKWQGGRWVGDDKTGWSFQASKSMLKKTHTRAGLQQYFAEYEPGVMLLMPTENDR